MSSDLLLKPMCRHCHTTEGLYGSNCKHMTLCMDCGTKMAEQRLGCMDCGVAVTRLIREYNVRPCSLSDKNYFIGRFVSGLPDFPKKQNSENKWSLQKEALQGRQQTDALREKYKNKPWLLEEETGQFQYSGHMEGAQSATYYLLIRNQDSKEFSAIPASSWYNFNKVAQYKQLTLEEAEEKMKNRRKTADGYQRWMMKAANNGPAAFGEVEKFDDKETGGGGGRGRKKSNGGDDDESNVSDRGEEDEEEEAGRKNRLKRKSGAGDDDEEGLRGGDLDFDDDNIEKGDDWEHEEIFTDDDEALGNDAEEREDLAPEIPPPPEIKQDEEDEEDDTNEEEGRLSKSGKELQKLLGRSNGESESDAEDDDDEDDDDDSSPVLAPKKKDGVKEEAGDNSPSKPSGSARGTPTSSKSTKGKRKTNGDDAKASSSTPSKKVKQEIEKSLKDETGFNSKSNVAAAPSQSSRPPSSPPTTHRPVTEDEIRAVLLSNTRMTTQALVGRFKPRLRTPEDKESFTSVLKKVGVINKNMTTGKNFVVLKDGRK